MSIASTVSALLEKGLDAYRSELSEAAAQRNKPTIDDDAIENSTPADAIEDLASHLPFV